MFDRPNIDYLSNNSASLHSSFDFLSVGKIASSVLYNGEPGLMNFHNVHNHKRVRAGEILSPDEVDLATIFNPCSEIPLEDKELCNLVEVFPTRCSSNEERQAAMRLATLYAHTVSLLPTHSIETNDVISRNHRIGVSISGISEWLYNVGAFNITRLCRDDYALVTATAERLSQEYGISSPIRCTTVKPSGTISLLAGVPSGMHFPTFQHAIRRIRIAKDSIIEKTLINAGVPYEPAEKEANTTVFSYPVQHGRVRSAIEVSAWEQFSLLTMLQREWADNSVSCTIYFDPEKEGKQLEYMLGQFLPLVKSVSMLPHTEKGAYQQMPYEGISKKEYERMLRVLGTIDWENYRNEAREEGDKEINLSILYCDNDSCEIPE